MLTFSATLSGAALAFGCLVNRPPEPAPTAAGPTTPHPGGALFASYCTGCHTIDEAVLFTRAAPDVATARAELTTLLASHGDSSPGQDASIVEFVLSKR